MYTVQNLDYDIADIANLDHLRLAKYFVTPRQWADFVSGEGRLPLIEIAAWGRWRGGLLSCKLENAVGQQRLLSTAAGVAQAIKQHRGSCMPCLLLLHQAEWTTRVCRPRWLPLLPDFISCTLLHSTTEPTCSPPCRQDG